MIIGEHDRFLRSGLTSIELLVAIAVATIIFASSISVFVFLNKSNQIESLNKAAGLIKSRLEEARSLTTTASEAKAYGVHFAASQVVLFSGTYTEGAPSNDSSAIGNYVTISTISLNGGGSNVVFSKLTGETNQFGNVIVSLISDPTKTKTINISQTGFITLLEP